RSFSAQSKALASVTLGGRHRGPEVCSYGSEPSPSYGRAPEYRNWPLPHHARRHARVTQNVRHGLRYAVTGADMADPARSVGAAAIEVYSILLADAEQPPP